MPAASFRGWPYGFYSNCDDLSPYIPMLSGVQEFPGRTQPIPPFASFIRQPGKLFSPSYPLFRFFQSFFIKRLQDSCIRSVSQKCLEICLRLYRYAVHEKYPETVISFLLYDIRKNKQSTRNVLSSITP
jgi:hypothetical protein